MLILSRKRDETLMIGDHIAVTVVDIRGDKVRLGITAPADVVIDRLEIYIDKKKDAANEQEATDG